MRKRENNVTKSHWNNAEFVAEMESREASFLAGTAKTYSWQEVQFKAMEALKMEVAQRTVRTRKDTAL